MAAKAKCARCGAKNALDASRCRVCTSVINPYASTEQQEPAAPSPTPGLDDHFDADVINRQLQPARSHFGKSGSGGGLSARIAAANGGKMPQSVFGSGQTPTGAGARAAASSAPPTSSSSSSTSMSSSRAFSAEPMTFSADVPSDDPGPAPAPTRAPEEFEPFDADALFRDMGSPD